MVALSALTGCLIWIPIAIWAVGIVQWWIGGEINVFQAIFALWVVFGLGIIAINPPIKAMAPIAFVAMVVGSFSFPFVRAAMNRRALRSIDVDALRRSYDALGQRPNEPMLRVQLAKTLWGLGLPAHALRIAEASAPNMPPAHFQGELRMIRSWQARMATRPKDFYPVPCPKCHKSLAPGPDVFCPHCGAPFLLLRLGGGGGSSVGSRKMFAAWVGLLALVVAIPVTPTLPKPWGFVALTLSVIGAIGMVAWAFLMGEE